MAEMASSFADAAVADAAVADAAVADAIVADAIVADAILKLDALAPRHCGPSSRKRSSQACRADLCALLAACRVMLLFFIELPTPFPNRVRSLNPSCVEQYVQKAMPLLDPSHVSSFCDAGLTSENSALHSHRLSRTCKGHTCERALGKRGSRCALPALRMHAPQTCPPCPSSASSFSWLVQPWLNSPM